MSDQQLNNENSSDIIDNGTSNNDVEQATSEQSSTQNVENYTVNNDASQETENADTQRNINAERGKIQALEKERNEMSRKLKEAEEYKSAVAEIKSTFENNPQAREAFWNAYNARTQTAQSSNQNVQSSAVPTAQYLEQQVEQVIQRKEAERQIRQHLFEVAPEMNSDSLQDERSIRAATIKANGVYALAQELLNSGETTDVKEAIKLSYNSLYGVNQQQVDKAREQGQLSAYANQNSRNMGNEALGGSATKPAINQSTQITLTPSQQKMYEEMKSKDPKVADIFKRKIADSQQR